VAARKRKKKSWIKRLVFYVCFPLVVWFAAFLVWFYWNDLAGVFTKDRYKSRTVPKAIPRPDQREKSDTIPPKRSQEKILEEDRQKLEDILKRRS